MKKITLLMTALLGSVYFAEAQVGIGTLEPNTSSYLDVTATDKGILIPRVELRSTTEFGPIVGDQAESLLVYNIASSGTGDTAVMPGFYYWKTTTTSIPAHWERITTAADLNAVINNLDTDVEAILKLLRTAYPSNNLSGTPTAGAGAGGGMIYTPAGGAVPAKIQYVYYDAASNNYAVQDITTDIIDLIQANESKTVLVKNQKYQYYISEAYLIANGGTVPVQADIDTWTSATFPAGVFFIDVTGGVVNNFSELVTNNPVTVNGTTYTTIQEYIENISQEATQDGMVKIVIDPAAPGTAKFQKWNNTDNSWEDVVNTELKKIVTDNETLTTLIKNSGTGAVHNEISYTYKNEAGTTSEIALTTDVLNSITNNTDIHNQIQNIINAGGNVYYGNHDNNTSTADVFYTIVNGVKTPINLTPTIINAITNADTNQTNVIKNKLGDIINAGANTSLFTGNTYIENGVTYYIYKGEFITTITAKTAKTTGLTLDKPAARIMSLNLNYGVGLTASTTDITLNNTVLGFNIGVGKMYNVVGNNDISAKVTVEFASTLVPDGL